MLSVYLWPLPEVLQLARQERDRHRGVRQPSTFAARCHRRARHQEKPDVAHHFRVGGLDQLQRIDVSQVDVGADRDTFSTAT